MHSQDPDRNGPTWNILLQLCDLGEHQLIRKLISVGADINKVNEAGLTVLARACENGDTDLVRFLLEHKANANAGGSSTLCCATHRNNIQLVRALLEAAADVNLLCASMACAPIHIAASVGDFLMIDLLVEHKADLSQGIHRLTPLHWAAKAGQP